MMKDLVSKKGKKKKNHLLLVGMGDFCFIGNRRVFYCKLLYYSRAFCNTFLVGWWVVC